MKKLHDDKYFQIACRWAPINYQYVNLGKPRRDMLCAINFDGDWDTKNNKRNLYDRRKNFSLKPIAYYSVAETSTHYFILYCFYHADDLNHENDLEGCLMIVKKGKNGNDKILGMITVAHHDLWTFVIKNRLQTRKKRDRGILYTEKYEGVDHPMIKQEPNKHGLYAWGSKPRWGLLFGLPLKDKTSYIGIKYVPGKKSKHIDNKEISTFEETQKNYVLINLLGKEGFWEQRNDETLFKKWGIFNSKGRKSANAPWTWKDNNDKLTPGMIFYDPVAIAKQYFAGFEKYDNRYIKTMMMSTNLTS